MTHHPRRRLSLIAAIALPTLAAALEPAVMPPDWRNLATGSVIPSETYVDQPYVVKCNDGAWLCVLTTSSGVEGATSEHVVSTRSTDLGKTWSPVVPLEPSGPPESAYATAVKTPSGRIYAFYDHNTDNVRFFLRRDGSHEPRVDEGGHFVFKFSDDNGRTWSPRRYDIPMRETVVDRQNVYHGKIRFFWHVGRPLVHRGAVYVTLHKIGGWRMPLNLEDTEGFFLRSDNLLTESDPTKIHWQTLPDGEIGLRSPAGIVAEEQSIVDLSDGSLFCTYRTVMGHSSQAYSRNDGHTWTAPAYMDYGPGEPLIKHPRAANFVWNAGHGHYLYWFHNNGGTDFRNSRNPAWISGGREVDTKAGKMLAWSQPEILLYGEPSSARISYPDFVQQDGRYYITETQKTIARVNEIPAEFMEMLWHQAEAKAVTRTGLQVDRAAPACRPDATAPLPATFDLTGASGHGGLTLDVWVRFTDLSAGQVLLDARNGAGNGFVLGTTDRSTVQLTLRGTRGAHEGSDPDVAECGWDSDPGALSAGSWHHLVVLVDNGPRIIAFVIDGRLGDGGAARSFGWARYSDELEALPTGGTLHLAPHLHGQLGGVRVYDRHLRVSEAVGNWRAGRE
jgi:hypothetical protein